MKYEEELVKQLLKPDVFLGFKDRNAPGYLNGMADDYIANNTIEGYIASLVIYHQLVDEILKFLYRFSMLISKASLYPIKLDLISIEEKTLGELINVHKSTIVFENKSIILQLCNSLNQKRNLIAHKIISLHHEDLIMKEIKDIQNIFEDIFANFQLALRWFYNNIDILKGKDEISKLIQKYKK